MLGSACPILSLVVIAADASLRINAADIGMAVVIECVYNFLFSLPDFVPRGHCRRR